MQYLIAVNSAGTHVAGGEYDSETRTLHIKFLPNALAENGLTVYLKPKLDSTNIVASGKITGFTESGKESFKLEPLPK